MSSLKVANMNYFLYVKSLRKLNRDRDRVNKKAFSKLIKETAKTSSSEKLSEDELDQSIIIDLDIIDDEISTLKTGYLIHIANNKSLPIPPITDKDGLWERSIFTDGWHLTNKGITEVRSLIRKDRKESMEICSYWAAILFGLIGVITGLIAVIKR